MAHKQRAKITDVTLITPYGQVLVKDLDELHIENGIVTIKFKGETEKMRIEDVHGDGSSIWLETAVIK